MNFFEILQEVSKEKDISEYIPFSSLATDDIVLCRNGELVSTWRVLGTHFETADEEIIESHNEQLNQVIKSLGIGANYAIYIHRIRTKVKDSLNSGEKSGKFIKELTTKYNYFVGEQSLMKTDLYISLVYKSRFKSKISRTFSQIKFDIEKSIDEFVKACSQLETALKDIFYPKKLTCFIEDNSKFSEQLAFYNFLITGQSQKIRVTNQPIYNILGNCHLFIGTDILQIETPKKVNFAQGIELKSFCAETYAGILNNLLYSEKNSFSFVECQCFSALSKNESLSFLKKQQAQLRSAKDAGITQTEQLTLAMDELMNENIIFGEYSYSLIVFGDTQEQARENCDELFSKILQKGYTPIVSTLGLSANYLSLLPCNFRYRPRIARLSSKNFTEQAPLHNFPFGKRQGNPWGEAVALLKTVSNQAYYFNFHVSQPNKNNFKDMLAGHTTILGMTGAGKTVTMNFLIAMAQKYRDDNSQKMTTIFFDKDFGAELAIRAMNGVYLNLNVGTPTGLNPFQIENTPKNQEFLVKLLKLIISQSGQSVTAYEEDQLVRAVRAVMSLDKEFRRIGLVVQNLTDGLTKEERENSLSLRLKRWVGNGDLAWVFDQSHDYLSFDEAPVIGIDGTNILANKDIAAPVISYFLYRLNDIKDGRKLLLALDEVWQWLEDDLSQEFVKDMLKTGRKQNVVLVMATQSPSDFIRSPIAPAIIEQSITQIFLPNLNANADEYINHFKVKAVEYSLIKNLSQTSRTFLVKQDGKSTLCKLDLSFLKNELKILSGTTENSAKLHTFFESLSRQNIDVSKAENWLDDFYNII